jgi:hypothetical protein
MSDTLQLGTNTTLTAFPIGTPLADWGEQSYYPMNAIGMGRNSSLLNLLSDETSLSSHTVSMFWGLEGKQQSSQLDGSLVLGGYDKAKVSGQRYTLPLDSGFQCPSQMVINIADIQLNFLNGTDTSIFPSDASKSSILSACIDPSYPTLMTLPLDPYFEIFEELTNISYTAREFGINYFTLLYSNAGALYASHYLPPWHESFLFDSD